jgi:hypothetical protein
MWFWVGTAIPKYLNLAMLPDTHSCSGLKNAVIFKEITKE